MAALPKIATASVEAIPNSEGCGTSIAMNTKDVGHHFKINELLGTIPNIRVSNVYAAGTTKPKNPKMEIQRGKDTPLKWTESQ